MNNCACQYFSLSVKTFSISSPYYTETFSVNWICKHSNFLAEERQKLRKWLATPHLTLPVFISILWILNDSLKLVVDPTYCLPPHLQNIKQMTFLLSHFKIPIIFYFCLVAKQVKSEKITKMFLQMSHFLFNFSIEHSFCLAILRNNDGNKTSLKFSFLLYVTLMVFCRKLSIICWILYKIGKWILRVVLRLGKGDIL